ncbi:hypothetical protein L917_15928, partial [Phytophthora nicotianae]
MPVLSTSKLPRQTIRASEVIEYISPQFVWGDPRSHMASGVLAVYDAAGNPLPLTLDSVYAKTKATTKNNNKVLDKRSE